MAEGHRRTMLRALGGSALAVALGLGTLATGAAPAYAATALSVSVAVPSSYVVGQSRLPGAVTIINMSAGAAGADALTVTGVVLTPACRALSSAGVCAQVDPGVLTVSAPVGETGTVCEKVPFKVVPAGAPGRVILAPTAALVLGPAGEGSDTCRVDFVIAVVGAPTADAGPAPGVQTAATASATASQTIGTSASATGSTLSTVSGGPAGEGAGAADGTPGSTARTAPATGPRSGRSAASSSTSSMGGLGATTLGFPSMASGMTGLGLSTTGGRLVPASNVLPPPSPAIASRPMGPVLPASVRLLSWAPVS